MSLGMRWMVAAGVLALGGVTLALARQDAKKPARIEDLAWLAGGWRCEQDGATVEEHWIAPAAGAMLAVVRTYKGERQLFFEFLRLEQRTDALVYAAHPGGASPGTEFKLTSWNGREAVFENPAHDFPKLIRYVKNDNGSVSASVEGDEGGHPAKEEFRYERIAN